MELKSWSMDDWNVALQTATVVLTGLAVITGALTIIVGKKVSEKQGAENLEIKTTLAQQQERAAKAEKDLLELRQKQAWRATGERLIPFREYLNNHEKGSVHVYYQAGDPEAQNLADNLREALSENGWAGGFLITPLNDTYGEINVHANNIDPRFDPLPRTLMDGLKHAGFQGVGASADSAMPTGEIKLVIGSRW